MQRLGALFYLALIPVYIWAADLKPGPAAAHDSGTHITWSTEVLASNNVVWRGFLSNRKSSLQPSITAEVGGFSVTSSSILEFDGRYCWKEHDLLATYSRPLSKRVSVEAGYTNFAYPSVDKERFAHEFFSGITVEGTTEATFQAFQNVGLSSGSYLSAGMSRPFRSSARFPVRTTASLGFNRKLFIPVSTFSDAVLTVSTEMPVRSGLRLSPQISYSRGLNRRYFDNHLTAGLRLSYKREKPAGSAAR